MGRLTCRFLSYTLARTIAVEVLLPGPVFGQPQPSHVPKYPYPLMYLLQGSDEDETSWLRMTSVERYAESYQLAVVTVPSEGSHYTAQRVDIPFGSVTSEAVSPLADCRTVDWSRFLLEELPQYMHATFPVSGRSEDSFLVGCGDSAADALRIAAEHPGRFAIVGAFGREACRTPLPHGVNAWVFDCENNWAAYDKAIEALIAGLPRTDGYAQFPPRKI